MNRPVYLESLKQKDPEIVFDPSKLRTKEDWIEAGKLVFESDIRFFPAPSEPPTKARYYIRKKGVLEFGTGASCAGCHTREMPDGSSIEGGQHILSLPKALGLKARQASPGNCDTEWTTCGSVSERLG